MKLNARLIENLVKDCLFTDKEAAGYDPHHLPPNAVLAEGAVMRLAFNKDRVEKHRLEIKELLEQLPDEFRAAGGYTFLKMAFDRFGMQWGEHRDCDNLICLGVAAGYVAIPVPRDLWFTLPGGVPYVTIRI